jgi:hypothetical protein
MSHDRGCFKCHEDKISYINCTVADCPKRAPIMTKVEARTCESCGRTEALWSNCFRLAADCPQRGGKPLVRIVTVTEPGYDVALFFNADGGAEAVITRPGDRLPIGVNIAPPGKGRRIVVERHGNTFEVMYKDGPL